MSDNANENLMNISETAAMLRVSEDTLRWLRHRGDGSCPPALKVGRRLMWRRTDVEAWIASRVQGQ